MNPTLLYEDQDVVAVFADPDMMHFQVKVVYVRNLPDSVTEEQLQKLFEHHGEVTKVVLPSSKPGQAKRDFGFVHFSDRASALKAIEKTEVYELEGKHLLVPIPPLLVLTFTGNTCLIFCLCLTGRVLETSLAKPPADKRPLGLEPAYPPHRAGLLPQYQARGGYGYGADIYNNAAYGPARVYNQVGISPLLPSIVFRSLLFIDS
jgi:heterogeneous nuclear ribonucleoprotein R